MELSVIKSPKLVVALDIGSTYSGYALQERAEFETNRSEIHFNTSWGAVALQLHKTTTCILLECQKNEEEAIDQTQENLSVSLGGRELNINDEIKTKIGHEAERAFSGLARKKRDADALAGQYYFFKRFKLLLYNEAGINKRNVLLALEPEAAAIYYLHLPEGQRKEMNDLGMKGQKFLVADLGGGTADLSAVEVKETGLLEEICPPLGDPVGGQKINDAFLQVCHDNFKGDGWKETLSKITPIEMLKMEADFERKKVTISSDDPEGEMIDIDVPEPLRDKLKDKTIRLKENNYLSYQDREFMFDSTLIHDNLFKECKVVYATIGNVLKRKEANGLRTVVLVGGFAESLTVIENIRQMVANDFPDIKVVVPSSPFKAVLKGAVLFGQNPMIFSSRISRETFGIETNSIFDPKVHDQTKKWKHKETEEDWCGKIFDVHVRKGQSVVLNSKQPVQMYIPVYKHQRQVGLPIYLSSSLNPKYTDNNGCKQIGKITVDLSDATGDSGREVEVTMIYGGTELSVIAVDKASGNIMQTSVLPVCNQSNAHTLYQQTDY